jgi:hypothetical protein
MFTPNDKSFSCFSFNHTVYSHDRVRRDKTAIKTKWNFLTISIIQLAMNYVDQPLSKDMFYFNLAIYRKWCKIFFYIFLNYGSNNFIFL